MQLNTLLVIMIIIRPEAYIAQSDTYIDKEASINDEIDMMRHSTTQSLLSRG